PRLTIPMTFLRNAAILNGMAKQEPGKDLNGPALRVLVQPDDGVTPVTSLIEEAQDSILVKMFTLTSPALVEALLAARARGVDVRVLLNPQRGNGIRDNDAIYERLCASGMPCA